MLRLVVLALAVTGLTLAEEPAKPIQPIPFSHKIHITSLKLKCTECHEIAEPGYAAGFPKAETCMRCHASVKTKSPAIAKLREYASKSNDVPWVRIYKVPDFVFFAHKTHVNNAKLDCEACHGAVKKHDVLIKEKPTSMKFCVDCHNTMGASAECNFCHYPG